MKKILSIVMLSLACISSDAKVTSVPDDVNNKVSLRENDLMPLSPTYLKGVYDGGGWGSNWFLSVKGGASAFYTHPYGCGDFFDHMSPLLNVSVGKWITPTVGGRISYQGLKYKNAFMESSHYQTLHADFLYNLSSLVRSDVEKLARWDFIPYAGAGIIGDHDTYQKSFALSYGFITRYRLARRWHLTGEIGGVTAFKDFHGCDNKFNDHLFHGSLGLSLTIGKVGWKHVIDAKPYIYQNDLLASAFMNLKADNERLSKAQNMNEQALDEMYKILKIEGLLDKYNLMKKDSVFANPKNNYTGLNSLRERLRNRSRTEPVTKLEPVSAADVDSLINHSDYIRLMAEGKKCVGAPVFFFFKLKTDRFTDRLQEVNLKQIAAVMKKYGLKARVIGCADSRTGSASFNNRLSEKRAERVAEMLMKYGAPEDMISTKHRGGVNDFKPNEANRNTCVMLFFNN